MSGPASRASRNMLQESIPKNTLPRECQENQPMRKHTSFATHPTAAPSIPAVTIGLDLSDKSTAGTHRLGCIGLTCSCGTQAKARSERQKNADTLYAHYPDFARNPNSSGDFPASLRANATNLLKPCTEIPSPA